MLKKKAGHTGELFTWFCQDDHLADKQKAGSKYWHRTRLEDPQRARLREEHTSYQTMDRMQAFSNMLSVEKDVHFIVHF